MRGGGGVPQRFRAAKAGLGSGFRQGGSPTKVPTQVRQWRHPVHTCPAYLRQAGGARLEVQAALLLQELQVHLARRLYQLLLGYKQPQQTRRAFLVD